MAQSPTPTPTAPSLDPFEYFREWAGQWEKLVNEHGGEMLAKPEVAKAMQRATNAQVKATAMRNEQMGRLLDASYMPSKADIEAIGVRLAAIEATLARIEANQGAAAPATPAPSGLRRTRKPPA